MLNPSSDNELSHQDLRELCMAQVGAHETFPFGLETMVFKLGVSEFGTPFKGKVFALLVLESDPPQLSLQLSLKGNPARVLELRAEYQVIAAGYHLSKKHWNTLSVDQTTLSREWVNELIAHSHALVAAGLA